VSHNDLEKTQNAVIFERIKISSIFFCAAMTLKFKFLDSGEKSLDVKISQNHCFFDKNRKQTQICLKF
jgi:hypothetical protein